MQKKPENFATTKFSLYNLIWRGRTGVWLKQYREDLLRIREHLFWFFLLFYFYLFIFFWWDWGLNSRLHTCKAGSLPLEPNLQSILLWLFWRSGGISWTTYMGWPPTVILLVSASQAGRTTGWANGCLRIPSLCITFNHTGATETRASFSVT
jgi:hypothetical protein